MVPLEGLARLPWAVMENAAVPCLGDGVRGGRHGCSSSRRAACRCAAAGVHCSCRSSSSGRRRPRTARAWIDVLDVGQGLAVVVRTAAHSLAYDAGPTWSAESDSGSRIVVPFLRGEGVRRLDGLVVSHADDDHAGGARGRSHARATPPWLLSSLADHDERHGLAPESRPCLAGERWDWDGVAFEVLHPTPQALRDRRRENDRSCVIRIASAGGSALLTADIERRAESEIALARRRPAALRRRCSCRTMARAPLRRRHSWRRFRPRGARVGGLAQPLPPAVAGGRGPLSRAGNADPAHRYSRRPAGGAARGRRAARSTPAHSWRPRRYWSERDGEAP